MTDHVHVVSRLPALDSFSFRAFLRPFIASVPFAVSASSKKNFHRKKYITVSPSSVDLELN